MSELRTNTLSKYNNYLFSTVAVAFLIPTGAYAETRILGDYVPGHYTSGDYTGQPVNPNGNNDNHVGQIEVNNGLTNTLTGSYASVKGGVPNWTEKHLMS